MVQLRVLCASFLWMVGLVLHGLGLGQGSWQRGICSPRLKALDWASASCRVSMSGWSHAVNTHGSIDALSLFALVSAPLGMRASSPVCCRSPQPCSLRGASQVQLHAVDGARMPDQPQVSGPCQQSYKTCDATSTSRALAMCALPGPALAAPSILHPGR